MLLRSSAAALRPLRPRFLRQNVNFHHSVQFTPRIDLQRGKFNFNHNHGKCYILIAACRMRAGGVFSAGAGSELGFAKQGFASRASTSKKLNPRGQIGLDC